MLFTVNKMTKDAKDLDVIDRRSRTLMLAEVELSVETVWILHIRVQRVCVSNIHKVLTRDLNPANNKQYRKRDNNISPDFTSLNDMQTREPVNCIDNTARERDRSCITVYLNGQVTM